MKTLYKNKWLELRETEGGYVYSHEARCGGHIVSVLVFNPSTGQVLGRYENTPCHAPGIKLCSITGGVENDDPLGTAVMELEEEAGIVADKSNLIILGTVWPSKSADTVVHMFAIPWDGPVNPNPEGDGSEGEKGATVRWISTEEAILCGDPLMPTMLSRLTVIGD